MPWSVVLEVAVGLTFLFSVLSLVASGINELIAAVLNFRGNTLKRAIECLVDGKKEREELYTHPLIRTLYRGTRRPSYIPPEKFAIALLDLKVPAAVGVGSTADANADADSPAVSQAHQIDAALATLPRDRLGETLNILWRTAGRRVEVFQKAVEGWFNDTMERAQGWYRRRTQIVLLVLGLGLAFGLNVSTITVTQRLWQAPPVRDAVIERARTVSEPTPLLGEDTTFGEAVRDIEAAMDQLDQLNLPIGWTEEAKPSTWYIGVAGWVLTGVAVSFGAPFWFDLLNRVARLRASGVRPDPSQPSVPGQAADGTR